MVALGDIQIGTHQPFDLSIGVQAGHFHSLDVVDYAIVDPANSEFAVIDPKAFDRCSHFFLLTRQLLRQDSLAPGAVFHQPVFRRRDAINPKHLFVPLNLIGKDIPFPNTHPRGFDGQLNPLPTRLQFDRRLL